MSSCRPAMTRVGTLIAPSRSVSGVPFRTTERTADGQRERICSRQYGVKAQSICGIVYEVTRLKKLFATPLRKSLRWSIQRVPSAISRDLCPSI